jgi:hypothetical protein
MLRRLAIRGSAGIGAAIGKSSENERDREDVGEYERELNSGDWVVIGGGEGTWRDRRRRRTSCCEERSWSFAIESVWSGGQLLSH